MGDPPAMGDVCVMGVMGAPPVMGDGCVSRTARPHSALSPLRPRQAWSASRLDAAELEEVMDMIRGFPKAAQENAADRASKGPGVSLQRELVRPARQGRRLK